ncbi:hypothetical protein CRUP_008536 [Coryphaenoides rupestris]|nr:hypothetical protein CRUP_008536 [Coryphaenoides rupestris]
MRPNHKAPDQRVRESMQSITERISQVLSGRFQKLQHGSGCADDDEDATMMMMMMMMMEMTMRKMMMMIDGHVPENCCLDVTNKVFPCRRVKSYILQDESTGCHIDATVYVTKKGTKLCVPHHRHSEWVRQCISAVNDRNAQH